MKEVCDLNQCTACQACVHVCPKHAITMKKNEYGIPLPVIDESKCINCGLCRKVCQAVEKDAMAEPQKCYAVWTKQEEDRKLCSSGGIATGAARAVLKAGGIVFGAAYVDGFHLQMVEATSEEDLLKFRGSKYVQCDTKDSYVKVRTYVESGKKVLYIGTPCQIMGLRKFLRKDYDNLILLDIICHGVPPFAHLEEYVAGISKDVSKVTFRGEYDFKLTVYENDKRVYCKDRFEDAYFTAFLKGMNYRENCYSCQYACKKRGSDITIGDFWGLNRETLKADYNGRISCALLNTKKGIAFFESIADYFEIEEREVDEAVQGNGQLQKPTTRPDTRDAFLSAYKTDGIREAYKKSGIVKQVRQYTLSKTLLYRTLRKVKKISRKVLRSERHRNGKK